MNLTNNGIVIQEMADTRYFAGCAAHYSKCETAAYMAYQGISRFISWPLEIKQDELSKNLTKEAKERWFYYMYDESKEQYALAVIPDIEYSSRYLMACDNLGIKTRLLFCMTERESPVWKEPIPKSTYLGYDYATSQDFYSPVPEDLLIGSIQPQFMKYPPRLNSNKLFENESVLNSYIQARQSMIDEGYDLERDVDFWIFRLSEVSKADFKSLALP